MELTHAAEDYLPEDFRCNARSRMLKSHQPLNQNEIETFDSRRYIRTHRKHKSKTPEIIDPFQDFFGTPSLPLCGHMSANRMIRGLNNLPRSHN